jgi:hypothetical protein
VRREVKRGIVVTFQNANVAHMGDLMSFQRNPRADRPAGASIVNWMRVLENTVKDQAPTPSTSSATRKSASA